MFQLRLKAFDGAIDNDAEQRTDQNPKDQKSKGQ